LRKISVRAFPLGNFLDETSPEYREVSVKRRDIKKFHRSIVTLWVDEGLTDDEIRRRVIMEWLAQFTPSELDPLLDGETRTSYETAEAFLAEFENTAKWDTILENHGVVSQMGLDGKYVITIVAKGKHEGAGAA
jgi:hypothetical protein